MIFGKDCPKYNNVNIPQAAGILAVASYIIMLVTSKKVAIYPPCTALTQKNCVLSVCVGGGGGGGYTNTYSYDTGGS